MVADKIKLVVLNENTLGYSFAECPQYVLHLHSSTLRGATNHSGLSLVGSTDKVRLASEKDFAEYNVHFGSFGNKYIYEFAESNPPYPTFEEAIGKVLDKKAEVNKQYR